MNVAPPNFRQPPEKPSAVLFWILMFAPTILALISGLCASNGPNDLGTTVGLLGFLVGCGASIYCSRWLARRFAKPGAARVVLGAATFLVIGVVNFIVTVAGCTGNGSFH